MDYHLNARNAIPRSNLRLKMAMDSNRCKFLNNLILMTDSYKFTHWRQYPPGTQKVYSYIESRGGMFEDLVFFGLQYYLKRYVAGSVFTVEDVEEADQFCREHFGFEGYFNRQGWLELHRSWEGKLPLEIKAVPEGTVVPVSNV